MTRQRPAFYFLNVNHRPNIAPDGLIIDYQSLALPDETLFL
jgi:hypothetical protein